MIILGMIIPYYASGEQYWMTFGVKRLGENRRMAVVRSQDEALTVDQLLLIGEISEEDWSKSNSEEENKELDSTIALSNIAFCVSLRGEEVPLIVIEVLNMFWKETRNHLIPNMMMTIKGRFKG